MEHLFDRALAVSTRCLLYLSITAIAAMMLHVCADVTLKYLFNQPIPATAEVVAHYYMVAAVFLPLPTIERNNSAISVDLFYNLQSPFSRRLIMVFAYAIQFVFFAIFAYLAALHAFESFGYREYISAQIILTVWPASFFIPAGLVLASLVCALRLYSVLMASDWEARCADQTQGEQP